MDDDCANCGAPAGDLAPVHRVYLLPERVRVDEVERWCLSCRTQYPHEVVDRPAG
ncbi:MAG TPA: hypothetical protein VFN60_00190 [Acidimicrobiales bacterium]|nr:hypothetical protein [Acidimicrobiales bacterium]